ncbi:MAG: HD domain-containing phosphohydrolase [Bacillota bacterium]
MSNQRTNKPKESEEVIETVKKTMSLMAELIQVSAVVLKISGIFYLFRLRQGKIIYNKFLNNNDFIAEFNPEKKISFPSEFLLEWPDGTVYGKFSIYSGKDSLDSNKIRERAEHFKSIIETYLKNIFLTEELIIKEQENEERNKELKCLFEITDLLTKRTNLEQLLYGVVEIIPQYMQFPAQANACITYQNQEYKSNNFKRTEKKITAPLIINNLTAGKIELNYIESASAGILEFLPEEINLLQNIAVQTSTLIEKKQNELYLVDGRNKISTTLNSIGDGVITTDRFGFITMLNPAAEKEEQLRSLAESAHAILWEYNIVTDHWDYVAPQAEKILGYIPEEWSDIEFWINNLHPDDQNWAIEYCFACTSKGEDHVFEYRFITKGGETVWLRDEVKVVMEDGMPVKLRGFMVDITERKIKEKQIRYISYHDSLTGCYNRTFLEEEIARLDTERQLPISIILADINGLKIINDSYGHLEGDELLIKAAELIKKSTRKEDLVTRWGGDEFVIMLPQTDKEAAQKIYNRIKLECDLETGIPISLGLGLATKDKSVQDIYEIIRQADMNMYRNKLLERNSSKSKIVKSLLNMLGAKSHETEEHALRMTKLAYDFGDRINLSNKEINNLSLLATLHDIGKTSIPEEILTKPGCLTEDEWEIVRQHPERGYKIASASEEFVVIAIEILSHHEKWDGSGYPRGLKGEEIPYLSRIITIIDAYDVMTTGRPYKESMSKEEALAEIMRCSGSQFDPVLAEEFVELMADKNPNIITRDLI